MTTAYRATGLELDGVRPMRSAIRRLRVLHGHPRVRWVHPRLLLGSAIAGAMLGALLAVGLGLLAQEHQPVELLRSYGAGAGLGALAGLLLGLLLSALVGLAARYLLPDSVRPRGVWVRYRRSD
jgi:hypothetical protein